MSAPNRRTGAQDTDWTAYASPKPPPVRDQNAFWSEPPPHQSKRCAWWLEQIVAGWRPNNRIRSYASGEAADWYGVFTWEYLNVISPALITATDADEQAREDRLARRAALAADRARPGQELATENAQLRAQLTAVSEALAAHPRACARDDDPAAVVGCGWKHAVADVEHAVRTALDADIPTASRAELEQFVRNTVPHLWADLDALSKSDDRFLSGADVAVSRLIDTLAWFGPTPEDQVSSWLVDTGVYAAVLTAAGLEAPERLTPRAPSHNEQHLIDTARECTR